MDGDIAKALLEKLQKVDQEESDFYTKIRSSFAMLDYFIEEVLQEEQIHFTTLFTKVSYLGLKYKLPKKLAFFSHLHRKQLELLDNANANLEKYEVARYVLIGFIHEMTDVELSSEIKALYKAPNIKPEKTKETTDKLKFARVHIFDFEESLHYLIGFDERIPEEKLIVKLNVLGKNDDYNSLLRFVARRSRFPFTLHLEQIEILQDGSYLPHKVVFEPDYLVDVTTISECFKPGESSPLFYFIKKFFPVFQNKYLIIGNTANYFLDEIFNNPQVSFQALLKRTFRLSPLGFSMMNDAELAELVSTLHKHYRVIKEVVQKQFTIHDITQENSFLEPSFYAPKYGIQGRLDLYSSNANQNESKIIELKSGKPYRANSYGLNINHYVQTLLYDLMVDAVNKDKLKISSFILYSSQVDNPLKFAPPLKIQQKEAIKLRNQLVEIDYLLADVGTDNDSIFSFINPEYIKSAGFAKRDIEAFRKTYTESSEISRNYFNAFTAFVAREQILAKTGEFGLDKSSGLAGLWLDDMQEKIDNFRVLNALEISEILIEKDYTKIIFKRTDATAPNANFRVGDLGVLYPYTHHNLSVLRNQIFKCSIIQVDSETVSARLRNKQNNTSVFDQVKVWHIEHDHLDHGFNSMYQDLFRFLRSDKKYQELMLGRTAPNQIEATNIEDIESSIMTIEQQAILKEMIAAQQYYLLWGPPGTGKTSVMLHEFLKFSFLRTSDTVLVLAYTNRAVDEICEAISRIGNGIREHYFRIGSRYSTNAKFVDDLLVTKLEEIENRQQMLGLLKNSRIIVSTLSSIHGKKELFSLLKIDTIIVDEASQILEPQLIGFLSNTKKFILIGDHNQLPAIVRQRNDESEVESEQLKAIGLYDRRNSLFERLYKRCEDRNWDWAIGKLKQQGRMHEQLMNFANRHFYHGQLEVIPGIDRLTAVSFSHFEESITSSIFAKHRLIYIPTQVDNSTITFKTNSDEAEKTAQVVKQILTIYEGESRAFNEGTLGIITPYRAQISAIQNAVRAIGIKEKINVDTVERYQGGARDIIIISMCINLKSQIKQLVNLSSDGVDRKLNVAMTRARTQIVILGNEQLLSTNEVYRSLIDACHRLDVEI